MLFNPYEIRKDFPILSQKINKKQLVYLDNSATSQKPKFVIKAIMDYYTKNNANVHRGVHTLANRATEDLEDARRKVASFIGSKNPKQIIFCYNATDALNMIANGYGRKFLTPGDSVMVTRMEHHANFVPWQIVCKENLCNFVISELKENGELDFSDFKKKLTPKVKIVCISHMSNVTGIINPIKQIIELAHKNSSIVVIDGAQGVVYDKVDVTDLDCDFYCFSGHKLYSSMGIGVLYGKESLFNKMEPFRYGGEMIADVFDDYTTFGELPYRFEGGTPNVAGAISLGAAIDYLNSLNLEQIHNYEKELFNFAYEKLQEINGLKIYGKSENQTGIVSFTLANISNLDCAIFLNGMGIAVRSGTHCAIPIMRNYGISGTIRASFSFYNTKEEVLYLVDAIKKVQNLLLAKNE